MKKYKNDYDDEIRMTNIKYRNNGKKYLKKMYEGMKELWGYNHQNGQNKSTCDSIFRQRDEKRETKVFSKMQFFSWLL